MASDALYQALAEALSKPSRAYRTAQAALDIPQQALEGYMKGSELSDTIRKRKQGRMTIEEILGGSIEGLPQNLQRAPVNSLEHLAKVSPFIKKETDPVDDALKREYIQARIDSLRNPPSKVTDPLDREIKKAKLAAVKQKTKGLEERAARSSDRVLAKSKQLIQRIDDALLKTGPWTAGPAGRVAAILPGTKAYDLSQDLMSIKANVGFETLQDLRASSPTGGALGQVSNAENDLMQSVWGSMQQQQSPSQLKENLTRIRPHFVKVVMAIEGQTGDPEADNAIAQVIQSNEPEKKKWAMIQAIKSRVGSDPREDMGQ